MMFFFSEFFLALTQKYVPVPESDCIMLMLINMCHNYDVQFPSPDWDQLAAADSGDCFVDTTIIMGFLYCTKVN